MNDQHRIVSSESEELILVDEADREIGSLSKAECHDGTGRLHRAFSVFLFDDEGKLLLQQRGFNKRLWPGFWSNSCCSHPRGGETLDVATERRLLDELNFSTPLEHVYFFCYQAAFGDAGSENELCHVYLGRVAKALRPNDSEIAAVRFVSAAELEREFAERPGDFTPWFRQEWATLLDEHREALGRYCRL